MEVNIYNIPKAIAYFFIGVFINIIIFFIFSPTYGDLLGSLASATTGLANGAPVEGDAINMIWWILFVFCILVNIALPAWVVFDMDNKDKGIEIT